MGGGDWLLLFAIVAGVFGAAIVLWLALKLWELYEEDQ